MPPKTNHTPIDGDKTSRLSSQIKLEAYVDLTDHQKLVDQAIAAGRDTRKAALVRFAIKAQIQTPTVAHHSTVMQTTQQNLAAVLNADAQTALAQISDLQVAAEVVGFIQAVAQQQQQGQQDVDAESIFKKLGALVGMGSLNSLPC